MEHQRSVSIIRADQALTVAPTNVTFEDRRHNWFRNGQHCGVALFGALGSVTLAIALWSASLPCVWAQDVAFTPRYDGVESKKGKKQREDPVLSTTPKPVPIYSFQRYDPELSEICELLERDGQREKVRELSERQDKKDNTCASCRFFARQVVASCKPIFAKKRVSPVPALPAEAAAEETPTPGPNRRAAEYPSTELIDRVSAFGTLLYDRDPGDGAVFPAVRGWADGLINNPDLASSERGYLDIFREYLLAAWKNRPGNPLEPSPLPKAKIQELFE